MANGENVAMVRDGDTLRQLALLYPSSNLQMLHSLYQYKKRQQPLLNHTKQHKPTMLTNFFFYFGIKIGCDKA